MATDNEIARPLQARRRARIEWLVDRWDQICPRYEPIPGWLRQLAMQLELWVGDELDDALHLEISFGPLADEVLSTSQGLVERNAYNSDVLYLRALTQHYFAAVDVKKASRQAAEAVVSFVITPRSRLESLHATDMTTRGDTPDSVRLTLRYAGLTQPFLIPHADDYTDAAEWRDGNDLRIFNELREDLWQPPETSGTAIITID